MITSESQSDSGPPNEHGQLAANIVTRFAGAAICLAVVGGAATKFGILGFCLSTHLGLFGVGYALRNRRWMAAGMAGSAAVIITCLAAWVWLGNTKSMHWGEQRWTKYECRRITDAVNTHFVTHNEYPQSFFEIELDPEHHLPIEQGENGELLVSTIPIVVVYEKRHDSFRLVWLGRDGAPGGEGLDTDLEFDQSKNSFKSVRITLPQFLFETRGSQGLIAALLPSLIMSVSILLDRTTFGRHEIPWVRILSTVICSAILGVILALFHTQAAQSSH